MYTIEEVADVSTPEFDSLFGESLPYMEGGTYDWSFAGAPSTEGEKREAIRARFQELIDLPNTKCVLWRKDGAPISLAAGSFNAGDTDYITWVAVLYGPDASGSRSWLYDETFIAVTKDYFLRNWGILGYKVSCIKDASIMRYHTSKPNMGNYYEVGVIGEKDNLVTIQYRYL